MVNQGRIHITVTDEHADLMASIEKNYRIKPSEFVRLIVDHIIDTNMDFELWAHRERLKRIEKEQARVQERIREIETARPVSASPEAKFELPAPRRTVVSRGRDHQAKDPHHLGGTDAERSIFKGLVEPLIDGSARPKAKTWFLEHVQKYPDWLNEIPPEQIAALETALECVLRVVPEVKSEGAGSPNEEVAK